MRFNSLEYFYFLPAVFILYNLFGRTLRLPLLLIASILFYAALKVPYLVFVLMAVTLFAYYGGLAVEGRIGVGRKAVLIIGLITIFTVFLSMRYLAFLSENINVLFSIINIDKRLPESSAIVSIGVSYYIFQAMSYLIDIYRGEKAERHLGWFSLYMFFFPKILQGPIERAGNLIPQLRRAEGFVYSNVRAGVVLFIFGLFKKIVIADRLAVYADTTFNDVHSFYGVSLITGVYAYTLQIYFDFSGYTDMALGTAKLFNVELMQNFNRPYLATSMAEFWRKWHISLSSWLRDYIYIPLGGNRVPLYRKCANIVIVFMVCGLWHGARWNFLIWGLLHGLFLTAGVLYHPYRQRVHRTLRLENTFVLRIWQNIVIFHLAAFAWIFFRAANISDALYVVGHIFTGVGNSLEKLIGSATSFANFIEVLKGEMSPVLGGQSKGELVTVLISMAFIFFMGKMMGEKLNVETMLDSTSRWLRWTMYYVLVVWILFFGAFNTSSQFIYFQF